MCKKTDDVSLSGHMAAPKYRADIDGLRAIAVLAVVAFHAFPNSLSGGFVGVDIFFVISGFLISSIIYENLEKNSFSFVVFYSRRIRRIFPSLLVVLAACLVFGWYVLLSNEWSQLGKHMAGGASFVSNIILWGESGYFDGESELKPLLHLWSLGIEEQFYILWPLILCGVWRSRFDLLRLTLFLMVASFGANIVLVDTDSVAAFYSPLTRIWELLIGASIAYVLLHKKESTASIKIRIKKIVSHRWPRINGVILRNAASGLGAALIATSLLVITKMHTFPGFWALLPTTGAALVIAAGTKAWVNRALLSNRVLVWFGLISFPLYLWHWPLLSFVRIVTTGSGGTPPRMTRVIVVLASILLAWMTYHLAERPLRFGLHGREKVKALAGIMVCFLIFGSVAAIGVVPPRIRDKQLQPYLDAMGDWEYPQNLSRYRFEGRTFYSLDSQLDDITAFIGDSHIEQYSSRVVYVLSKKTRLLNKAVFATVGGCAPIPHVYDDSKEHYSDCRDKKEAFYAFVHQPNVKTVVISGWWERYFDGKGFYSKSQGTTHPYYYDDGGNKVSLGTDKGRSLALSELAKVIIDLSQSHKVFIILDNPTGVNFDPKSYIEGNRFEAMSHKAIPRFDVLSPAMVDINVEIANIARKAGATVLNPVDQLCSDFKCQLSTEDGRPIYKDANHLRSSYVREHASFIDQTLFQY